MGKRIDLLINKLHRNKDLSLEKSLPSMLRRFVPVTAIICDAQMNEHNKPSWAIIYQDGTDTFLHIGRNNRVYLQGEHEDEIVNAMGAFIKQLQTYALQEAWFKQLSLNLFDQ